MTRLPILVSVPHAGLDVPPEVEDRVVLGPREIARDGDEQAGEIYLPLKDHVHALVTTAIARAFVDVNRPPDDLRPDGVVKTETCWQVPIYREPLPADLVSELLRCYYHPYHERLTELATAEVVLGVDCHTMAAEAPPIAPRPGERRPEICLGNDDGSCPERWLNELAAAFEEAFDLPVAVNRPFAGGHIIRAHADELPWVQLELSRAAFLSPADKGERVLDALAVFSGRIGEA